MDATSKTLPFISKLFPMKLMPGLCPVGLREVIHKRILASRLFLDPAGPGGG
jgi:hypothetical protein